MIKNYLKIAIRNLLNQKLFSFINILSLTVGITCSILLGLYVHDELSFDNFNTNKEDIYRVLQVNNLPDGSLQYEGIHHAIGLGPTLVNDNPSIEKAVRFFQPWSDDGKYYIKQNENSFYDKVWYADLSVFSVFSFPLTKGSIDEKNLKSVAISERAAKKYFGYIDPINKNLAFRINEEYVDFTVTAVFKNIPANSSIQFDVVLPFDYMATIGELKEYQNSWGFGAIITYVKLKPGTRSASLQDNLKRLMAAHYPHYEEIAKERGYKSTEDFRHFRLEPLLDVHFNSAIFEGVVPSSNPMYSYILMMLVVAILAIACFNFMNLSISRSANRMKEVGLRKSIGALRQQLIVQFIGESILLSLLAFIISLALVDMLMPVFNYLVDKQIDLLPLLNAQTLLSMVTLSVLIGTVAGFYPAFVISRFSVRDTLTGSKSLAQSNWFTKTLVTLQFSLSVILIIGMIVINKQVNYLKNKDLGFDANHVLVLNNVKTNDQTIFDHLKESASNFTGIQSITAANQTFANPSGLGGRGFTYKGERKRVGIIEVAGDYTETLGIQLVEGSSFHYGKSTENTVIINEACKKDFELQVSDVFQELTNSPETDPSVVGVMGDFNYSTLKMGVFPMLIRPGKTEDLTYIFIKINSAQTDQVVAFLENEWKKVAPELPFEYSYLNDTMAAQYKSEERWSGIMSSSMAIATLLSCMGLFGIVALGVESRKKEIGVRKILGAQVQQIMWLFTSRYLQLVIIAFFIAVPVSYYFIQDWLSTFAYRIEIDVSIFMTAALLIVVVSVTTICIKIFNAAMSNPVEALKSE